MMTITMGKLVTEWDAVATQVTTSNDLYTYKGVNMPLEVLNRDKYYVGKNWQNREHWRGAQYRNYVNLTNQILGEIFKTYYNTFHTYIKENNIDIGLLFRVKCGCNPSAQDILCGKCRAENEGVFKKIEEMCPKSSLLKTMRPFMLNETNVLNYIQLSTLVSSLPSQIVSQINAIWQQNNGDTIPLKSDAYMFCNGKMQIHTTHVILILTKPNIIIESLFEKSCRINAAIEYKLLTISSTPTTIVNFINDGDTVTTPNDAPTTTLYVKQGRISYAKWKNNGINEQPFYDPITPFTMTQCELLKTPPMIYVYSLDVQENEFGFDNIFAEDELLALIID